MPIGNGIKFIICSYIPFFCGVISKEIFIAQSPIEYK